MKVQVVQDSPSYKRLRTYQREQRREQRQDRQIKIALLVIVGAALMYALITYV